MSRIVGRQYTDQELAAALMMGGFSNQTTIGNMIQIGGWESNKTPQINDAPSESPRGYTGCTSNGIWQINYCPARDKGTIREQVANNPADPVLNARAAYIISNGGTDLNQWSTWKNRGATNPSVTSPNPSTIPANIGAGFVTTPFLGHVANDPLSLQQGGITSVGGGCAPPTGANALNPAAWIGYLVCIIKLNVARWGMVVLGVILLIVGLVILAKAAGDKTGVTQIATAAAGA